MADGLGPDDCEACICGGLDPCVCGHYVPETSLRDLPSIPAFHRKAPQPAAAGSSSQHCEAVSDTNSEHTQAVARSTDDTPADDAAAPPCATHSEPTPRSLHQTQTALERAISSHRHITSISPPRHRERGARFLSREPYSAVTIVLINLSILNHSEPVLERDLLTLALDLASKSDVRLKAIYSIFDITDYTLRSHVLPSSAAAGGLRGSLAPTPPTPPSVIRSRRRRLVSGVVCCASIVAAAWALSYPVAAFATSFAADLATSASAFAAAPATAAATGLAPPAVASPCLNTDRVTSSLRDRAGGRHPMTASRRFALRSHSKEVRGATRCGVESGWQRPATRCART